MAQVVLDGVTKTFGDVVAVDDVTLTIDDGEFLVLVGPSGCGKSTILRIIAGLEELTGGEVHIGGDEVTFLPPRDRDVAMVFQNYALYPHMTVAKNLSFGLRLRKTPKAERGERVAAVAEILGLDDLMDRKPAQLSGGQRQRVAMGRAMVREPRAFLMDEPLSNLDAKLRVQMRAELVRLHERLRTTTIYVTHDQVEAMTLGHRVAVMLDGVLQQVDTPHGLYASPANLFVATFIGSPPMNLVEAKVDGTTIGFGGFELPAGPTDLSAYDGRTVIVGIRPSDMEDHAVWQAPGLPVIDVSAEVTEDIGSEVHVMFRVDAPPVDVGRGVGADEDGGAGLLPRGDGCVFCARVDARTSCTPGSTITLSVDPARFHYFDPSTGVAIAPRTSATT